ncbi:MAG: Hsp33 family molecular chaperone HslO [Blastocatellia bacterium]|nr:Hsp33 family molecular chaperone HslO [Blastocatellia bacterium]
MQKKKTDEPSAQPDRLLYATAADNTVRCVTAVTTNLAQEACQRHMTWKTASVALGRALTGAALLASQMKELERLTLHFQGRGPLGSITVDADAHGRVRGFVQNPQTELPLREDGKINVGEAVGKGVLHVIRDAGVEIGFSKDPYQGSVPLVTGEIAEDLTFYLTNSEQIPSAMSLGVYMDRGSGHVSAAGGFLVQVMPDTPDHIITHLENAVLNAPPSTEMIRGGATPEIILEIALGGLEATILSSKPLHFACTCSQERAVSIISALGKTEVRDMLEKDGQAELTCHYCNSTYLLNRDDLENILNDTETS